MPDRWNKARKWVADAEAELDAAKKERKEAREELQCRLDESDESITRSLTHREREIHDILRERPALQNKEIAERLNISLRAVKFHISNILRKFDKKRRLDL